METAQPIDPNNSIDYPLQTFRYICDNEINHQFHQNNIVYVCADNLIDQIKIYPAVSS